MRIAQLRIHIGDHQIHLTNCDDQNPDIQLLLEMAKTPSGVIAIRVPQSEETASAMGRLAYGGPRSVNTDMVPVLSKRIEELRISGRVESILRNAGLIYIWQVVDRNEVDLEKIKHVGRKSQRQILDALAEIGLEPGMDLSKVRDHLPKPEPKP